MKINMKLHHTHPKYFVEFGSKIQLAKGIMKIEEFAISLDSDEMAHNESLHLGPHFLLSSL